MAATVTAPPPLPEPTDGGGVDRDDSNISSPLSEVDDKDTNDEDIEHMQLDGDDHRSDSSLSGDEDHRAASHAGSDSESALSDAHSDINSEGNDTEAETERLYDTPQGKRHRDVVVDQFNDGHVYERTPSKLRSAAAIMGHDRGDEESLTADDGTAPSSPAASEAAPHKNGELNDETPNGESQERKRKRSPASEHSDTDQPLRKRKGSAVAGEDDVATNEDDLTNNVPSGARSVEDDGNESPTKRDKPIGEETTERETRFSRKNTRSRSKRKDVSDDADDDETMARDISRDNQPEGEEAEHHDEEAGPDAEEDEVDAAAKNLEELERKQAAFKDWKHIEEMFVVFRERLYKDRLQRLEEEEQSLLADVPTHPEYVNMKRCLDEQLEQKTSSFKTELNFRFKANERRAVAQRAQTWSQYFQAVREKREQALEGLNKEWYDIQAARRRAHSLPDFGLLFPQDPADRVRNAIAYNTEVSTLAGIAKYEGFPAGPEITPATTTEIEDDLSAMRRNRKGRQKPPSQPRDDFQTPSFARLGPAGEQFIKDTPWANPNHSVHRAFLPGHQPEVSLPASRT